MIPPSSVLGVQTGLQKQYVPPFRVGDFMGVLFTIIFFLLIKKKDFIVLNIASPKLEASITVFLEKKKRRRPIEMKL